MANATTVHELQMLAKAHLLAKSAFNRAYHSYWTIEAKPCSDEVGWKLLEAYRLAVKRFRFDYERIDVGIEQAAWEIFRLQLVGDADYSFEDATGFVKWYESLKNRIEWAIGHFFEFQGDTFADLVDSYPLAGRELIDRALASHPESARPLREGFLDESEVRDLVLEKLGLRWHKMICEGANYVLNALDTACRKCYLHRILTGVDERVKWTEDERKVADFAGHYDN